MNEILKMKVDKRTLAFNRANLQSFYEDLFFRNLPEETMVAPDGKRSAISIVDLRNLINKVPEETDQVLLIRGSSAKSDSKKEAAGTRELIDMMREGKKK